MTTAAMTPPVRPAADLRPWIRWTRLVTGLVLLSYVLSHLLNHALGLWSLEAMEEGRGWFLAAWRHRHFPALYPLRLLPGHAP